MKFSAKIIVALLVCLQFLLHTNLNARAIVPLPAAFKTNMQPAMSKDGSPKINMLLLYAGVAAGGKNNTAYFLKSRLILADKFHLYGSAYFHFNDERIYFGSVGFGNIVEFSAGMEWGSRRFFVPKDSTYQRFHFKNKATGADEFYSTFEGFSFAQEVTTYTLGLTFRARQAGINYWRGKGYCWAIYEFKWEMLYAPNVNYASTIDVFKEGEYEQTTDSYEIVDERVRHWGVRMVADTRLTSKIGMMLEFGLRPGIKYDLNENHRFSNGYVRIGVSVGLALGGRRALKEEAAGLED